MAEETERFTFVTRCTNCGATHSASRNACPSCGAAAYLELNCGHCGHSFSERSDAAIACPSCGRSGKPVRCARCGVFYSQLCSRCPNCHSLNVDCFISCTECDTVFPKSCTCCSKCEAPKAEKPKPKKPAIPVVVTCEHCGQLFYNVGLETSAKVPIDSHPVFRGEGLGFIAARSTVGNRCPSCGVPAPPPAKHYTSALESDKAAQSVLVGDEHRVESRLTGFVYVLLNPQMQGLVKIGKTTRDANVRVAELSQQTGVPAEFILVFQQEVTDCDHVERLVHERLIEHRLPNKEFFKVPVEEAIRVLIEASEKFRPS